MLLFEPVLEYGNPTSKQRRNRDRRCQNTVQHSAARFVRVTTDIVDWEEQDRRQRVRVDCQGYFLLQKDGGSAHLPEQHPA